jgi:hypothetical protein
MIRVVHVSEIPEAFENTANITLSRHHILRVVGVSHTVRQEMTSPQIVSNIVDAIFVIETPPPSGIEY